MPLWAFIVVALLVVLAAAALFDLVRIFEFERGLKYTRGRFRGLLEPGQYWVLRYTSSVRKIDIRPRFVSVPGQEVLSDDGVTLRVSLVAEYEVVDPARAVNEVEDFQQALHLTLQLALRHVIAGAPVDDLLARRTEFGRELYELAVEPTAALGLKLRRVDLKDVMFPGELKRVFAQVVNARKEGLAALERARGETAALRNLANAARMVEGSPALMQLRLLQQLGQSGGNTIVLGFPPSATPLPLRHAEVELPPDPPPPADRGT